MTSISDDLELRDAIIRGANALEALASGASAPVGGFEVMDLDGNIQKLEIQEPYKAMNDEYGPQYARYYTPFPRIYGEILFERVGPPADGNFRVFLVSPDQRKRVEYVQRQVDQEGSDRSSSSEK